MSTEVMAVVLLGALLHASWNAFIKSGQDKFLDTVLVAFGAGLLACVALPFLAAPARESWPYLAGSSCIHVLYFSLVAAAYRAGDMSYAYPIMRGTAPIIVAVLSGPLLGEYLTPAAWIGIVSICAGVLALAALYRRPNVRLLAPTLFALANTLVIAGYTFVDGMGARASNSPIAYTIWLGIFSGLALLAWAAATRPKALAVHFRRRGLPGLIGGAASTGSYALALWAMTRAPIAPVAALRETSILFGMLLAAFVLKEKFGPARHVAAATVVVGAIALRLA